MLASAIKSCFKWGKKVKTSFFRGENRFFLALLILYNVVYVLWSTRLSPDKIKSNRSIVQSSLASNGSELKQQMMTLIYDIIARDFSPVAINLLR